MTTGSRTDVPVAGIVLAIGAGLALALALPGRTVTTRYLSDLFIALDGAHRVLSGQVPGRDFHTPLGPLVTYIPAVGAWISGSLGGAMPVGMALVVAALAPAIAYVVASRLHPIIAVPFAAFLLLILAAPMNLGESVTSVSHAKFYNRIGWVALAALLVMYLPTRDDKESRPSVDAVLAALLTTIMLYTKVTYGVVALAFLGFMLFDRAQRTWAGAALGGTLAAAAVIEVFWQATAAHLGDVLLTLRVGGAVRGSPGQMFDHFLGNFADCVFLALLAGLALRAKPRLRDAAFYLFCAAAGFLLINQNFQTWGIISLHAAAAVAGETLVRRFEDDPYGDERERSLAAGAQLVVLAMVLPTIVHCAVPLTLHAAAATLRAGAEVLFANMRRIQVANLWTPAEYGDATRYMAAVGDGAEVLSRLDPGPARVFALDFVNPFSAALGLTPARGDSAFLHVGRNLDARAFIPPERLLADVEIVMEPKAAPESRPAEAEAAIEVLRTIYLAHVTATFNVVAETAHWRVHRRRAPPARVP